MKVILSPAVTIDGFLADEKGDCYSWVNPEDETRYEKSMQSYGCELVGRKTYEQYKDSYDARTEVMSFVYTSNNTYVDTDKIKFVRGTVAEVLSNIKGYGFETLILSGGGELNGSLAKAGAIDEIWLSVHAIALGSGIPLFGSHKPRLNLSLINSNQDIPGIIQNRYAVIKQSL